MCQSFDNLNLNPAKLLTLAAGEGVIINLERNVSAYMEEAFHLILTPRSPSLLHVTPAFASMSYCWLSDSKCLSAYTHQTLHFGVLCCCCSLS